MKARVLSALRRKIPISVDPVPEASTWSTCSKYVA